MITREQNQLKAFFEFLDGWGVLELEKIDFHNDGGATIVYIDEHELGFDLSAFRTFATALGFRLEDARIYYGDPSDLKVLIEFEPQGGKQ